MAVIINGTGQWDFDGDETVSITATFTLAGGDWIQKTDNIAQTILMSAGVIITVATTSFVSVSGQRPTTNALESGMVVFDSVAANKQRGDWGYFYQRGTNVLNFMNWCLFKNCQFGLVFGDHAPAENKFRYLWTDNTTFGFATSFNGSSAAGSMVVSDIGGSRIMTSGNYAMSKGGTMPSTWKRMTMLDMRHKWGQNVTKDITIEDFYFTACAGDEAPGWRVAPGETVSISGFYEQVRGESSSLWLGTNAQGKLAITNGICTGGRGRSIPHASGTCDLTNVDIGPGGGGGVMLFSSNVNCFALDNVSLRGGNGADEDVFDNDTTTPDSAFAIPMYTQAVSVVNPRTTRIETPTITSPSADVSVAGEAAFTCTTGMLARVRVLLYRSTNDLAKGKVVASDWDVPDVYINGSIQIPCAVTDWGPEAGVKYNKSHSIKVDHLEAGDYFYDIEAEFISGEKTRLGEQSAVTILSATSAGGTKGMINCVA